MGFNSLTDEKCPYTCAQLSSILKVLYEEHRMRILCLLMQGERCVQEISRAIKIPQSLTSHHLKVLWDRGIVKRCRDERDSRWIYYSVNREALAELNALYLRFFDENRSDPCQPSCCCRACVVAALERIQPVPPNARSQLNT
jgi:ArsR family transcriptional regulator